MFHKDRCFCLLFTAISLVAETVPKSGEDSQLSPKDFH